jgi:dTDP-glucose pyrophosphorylase
LIEIARKSIKLMTLFENQSWYKALLPTGASIQQAILNLDKSGIQIALIISENGTLCGTVTDGDVRRALLRGLDLQSRVDDIMFLTPMVATPEMGRDTVWHLMRANRVHQLPVVDNEGRVVGLHTWDEVITPSRRPNIMVIMAGGLGKRLRPFTEDCPKPMLSIAGKPMLEHIIERAKAEGFHHFVIAIHYLGHMIVDYFGDGSRWQVRIDYLREKSPMGTAGALGLLPTQPEESILVTNGDLLSDIRYGDLLDFHKRNDASATMAVRLYEWQNPFGVVKTNGVDIVGFEEKPIFRSHINAGVYVLEPCALDALSADEHCDMPTLFSRLQERAARTIVYPMHEPWLDVGNADDLERAHAKHSQNAQL